MADKFLKKLHIWEQKLKENLTFPFTAKVIDSDRKFPHRIGQKLTVLNILSCDDLYGIFLSCRIGRKKHSIPFCNITPQDTESMNYPLVKGYVEWFDNR